MTGLRERVRERLRERLLTGHDAHAFEDTEVFDEVEALLYTAASTSDAATPFRDWIMLTRAKAATAGAVV